PRTLTRDTWLRRITKPPIGKWPGRAWNSSPPLTTAPPCSAKTTGAATEPLIVGLTTVPPDDTVSRPPSNVLIALPPDDTVSDPAMLIVSELAVPPATISIPPSTVPIEVPPDNTVSNPPLLIVVDGRAPTGRVAGPG